MLKVPWILSRNSISELFCFPKASVQGKTTPFADDEALQLHLANFDDPSYTRLQKTVVTRILKSNLAVNTAKIHPKQVCWLVRCDVRWEICWRDLFSIRSALLCLHVSPQFFEFWATLFTRWAGLHQTKGSGSLRGVSFQVSLEICKTFA